MSEAMSEPVLRKSTRKRTPVDRLANKSTDDWRPSTSKDIERACSASRPAENQENTWHFQEATAKQEGHPSNPKVKKERKDMLKELEEQLQGTGTM